MSHKGPWALLKWVNDYGPIFKFAVAPYGVGVVLSDPDTIARVTRKTGSRLLANAVQYGLSRPFDNAAHLLFVTHLLRALCASL